MSAMFDLESDLDEQCIQREDRSRSNSVDTCIRNDHVESRSRSRSNETVRRNSTAPCLNNTEEYKELQHDDSLLSNFAKGAISGALSNAIITGLISSLKKIRSKPKSTGSAAEDVAAQFQTEKIKKHKLKTELTEDEIQFIMANTDFKQENVLKWFEQFKLDCPDCHLNKRHFIEFYKNLVPGNDEMKEEFSELVFKAFDQDNNGYVDFGEFLIAFWVKSKGSVERKLSWLFEVYDSDKSNYVSHGELVHMLTLLFNIKNIKESPIDKADLVMRLIDKDHDGLLSKHEFIQACLKDKDMINLLEA